MKLFSIALFLTIAVTSGAQVVNIKIIPYCLTNCGYYKYSNPNTSSIKYPYTKFPYKFDGLNVGLAGEIQFKKFSLGLSYEGSSLVWGIDGGTLLLYEKLDTVYHFYVLERSHTKTGGYASTTARRAKLFYSGEIFRFNFNSFKNILHTSEQVEKKRSIRFGIGGNVSLIKKILEQNYSIYEIDQSYNFNGVMTTFQASTVVLRQYSYSAGLSLMLSQYYKSKERWRMVLGYDLGFRNIISAEYRVYEDSKLIHENNITNKGTQFYLSFQIPITVYNRK